ERHGRPPRTRPPVGRARSGSDSPWVGARMNARTEPSHAELAEVPARDLGGRELQPRVPAVVEHLAAALVLRGEEALGRRQRVIGSTGARHIAHPLDAAVDLDALQLVVVLARFDEEGDARVA